MSIKSFKDFIAEGLGQVRDKKVKHTEDIESNDDGSSKEVEKKVNDYVDSVAEECVRCGEHIDDCKCESDDPWSTQVYHRAEKGKEYKAKPKQEFKK